MPRNRASAVIVNNNQILLFHRIKNGEEYYIFPGGGNEEGETPEQALVREVQEELSLKSEIDKKLFEISDEFNGENHFFLVKNFEGEPKLGGPEAEYANENNQFIPVWIKFSDLGKILLYPEIAKSKVLNLLS